MFTDTALTCRDCLGTFVFSAGEKEFFVSRGLTNEPRRCPNCRVVTRLKRSGKDTTVASAVHCADCGEMTTVPFRPKGHSPIYCTSCFRTRKLGLKNGLIAV